MKHRIINWFIRRIALRNGFLDPFALLDRLRSFSRPSKVQEPIELVRAGAVFHARGLLNTKAIQNNMDWVWPYWVEEQFDPHSPSFLPRAFSATHVNLTHRNWTATGVPDCVHMPIVDPRGLVTPLYDGWSIDCWFIPDEGEPLFPSKVEDCRQKMGIDQNRLVITTELERDTVTMMQQVWLSRNQGNVRCIQECSVESSHAGNLVIAPRPFNPEGVSFIDELALTEDGRSFIVNKKWTIEFSDRMDASALSTYEEGDVSAQVLPSVNIPQKDRSKVACSAGMATGAAMFRMEAGDKRTVTVSMDCSRDPAGLSLPAGSTPGREWDEVLQSCPQLECPDEKLQTLYDQSLITLTLLSPEEVYPGPYTYRRFWFRDAALMMQALLFAGQGEKCREMLNAFPDRQTLTGYFHSQEGEWDSNGQVLWIYDLVSRVMDTPLTDDDLRAIRKGAEWILNHRVKNAEGELHQGLMPPGFSAEHLGSIDHYWWDVFWSVGGLAAAGQQLTSSDPKFVGRCQKELGEWGHRIDNILARCAETLQRPAIAAGPYRRMDAGAIGSLAGSYPLRFQSPTDERVLDTVAYLRDECFFEGAFFQDMIHSGMNAYLSIHIAQVLMRAGDKSFWPIVQEVARLASSTGQWPEAIHPATKGGCMGDGQHGWAAGEWFVMIRNMLIREEGDELLLGCGLVDDLLTSGDVWHLSSAPTEFGRVDVKFSVDAQTQAVEVKLQPDWHRPPSTVWISLPGQEPVELPAGTNRVVIPLQKGREVSV